MGLKKATVKLGADISQFTSKMKKASRSFKKMGKSMQRVGKTMSMSLTLPLVAFAAASVKAFDVQAKAEAKLRTALKGNEAAFKSLKKQAQELQKVTLFGDEQTMAAQSMLASMGLEEEAIKRLTPLIQDMATAKGMDLKAAADLVAKSVGSSTNALSRYGIQIEGAVGSTDRLDSAVNALSGQFKGQAKAAADAGAGGLQQLMNLFGDLMETVGGMLMPILTKLTDKIKAGVEWFTSLNGKTKKIIITIGVLLAALGPTVALLGTMATVIGALISPIGLAVLAIAAIAAAFIYVRDNFDAFAERLGDWTWWRNALIQALQWFIEYNPMSLILKGFNSILEFFGKNPIPNPFEAMADGLEDLKSDTVVYEHEFGSFARSVKKTAAEVGEALSKMGAKLGIGTGGTGTDDQGDPVSSEGSDANKVSKALSDLNKQDLTLKIWIPTEPVMSFGETLSETLGGMSGKVLEFAKKWGDAFAAAFNFIGQALENQSLKLDAYYEKEQQKINESKMSEEAKQDALIALDKKVAKQRKKIARKQAIADKAAALFSAIIGTAEGIARNLKFPPMAIAMGILGAAQIALIASTPLPALAAGGPLAGGQPALVGENGPEIFQPRIGGTIIPNHALGGGGNISGEFIIRGSDLVATINNELINENGPNAKTITG